MDIFKFHKYISCPCVNKKYLKQRCWEAIKSLVCRSKDCDRPREAENVNEICQLEEGDKDGKVGVVDE